MEVDLADSIVVSNEDIIDKKERKEVYIDHTIEIEIYAKPRLMPSNHLTCHFVTLYRLS